MEDQDASLNEGKTDREESVEKDGEDHNANSKQSGMPCFKTICVVVQSNEALNDAADHESDGCQEHLPAYRAKPACRVTQDLLVLRRCKLADLQVEVSLVSQTSWMVFFILYPMILAAGCRTPVNGVSLVARELRSLNDCLHACHLGEGGAKRLG